MDKVTSLQQLCSLKEKFAAEMLLRDTPEMPVVSKEKQSSGIKRQVLVCAETGCLAAEGYAVYDTLADEVKKQGMDKEVEVVKTGCFGFCERGPIVKVLPEDSFYVDVHPEDAEDIIHDQIGRAHV